MIKHSGQIQALPLKCKQAAKMKKKVHNADRKYFCFSATAINTNSYQNTSFLETGLNVYFLKLEKTMGYYLIAYVMNCVRTTVLFNFGYVTSD